MARAATHTHNGGTVEFSDLFMRMVEQVPAVGILLYLAIRQQALINTVIDACMEHFGNEEEDDE